MQAMSEQNTTHSLASESINKNNNNVIQVNN